MPDASTAVIRLERAREDVPAISEGTRGTDASREQGASESGPPSAGEHVPAPEPASGVEAGEADSKQAMEQTAVEQVAVEMDANLATTLGRPKTSDAPTGQLGSMLGGRSMFAARMADPQQGDEVALADTTGLKEAYDEEAVRKAWAELVEDTRSRNKVGLAATLANGRLDFEDPLLRLTVSNQVQFTELKECATELLHFIRVRVGNGDIAFEVEVSEAGPAPEFLTPMDRYRKWAEANPALEQLRTRLDLDLG